MSAARSKFTPEFLNRLDEMVVFNTLTKDDIKKIMYMECGKIILRLSAKAGLKLEFSTDALKELLARGYNKKYNARGIRRTIEKEIMTPMARAISSFEAVWGDTVLADYKDEKFIFTSTTQREGDNGLVRIYPEGSIPERPVPLSELQQHKGIASAPHRVL